MKTKTAKRKKAKSRKCPRTVAGKRCRRGRPMDRLCICERYYHHILDHAQIYNTPEGTVLTSEPYYLEGKQLAAFLRECHNLDLAVTITGDSPYYPGATVLITIKRRQANTQRPQTTSNRKSDIGHG